MTELDDNSLFHSQTTINVVAIFVFDFRFRFYRSIQYYRVKYFSIRFAIRSRRICFALRIMHVRETVTKFEQLRRNGPYKAAKCCRWFCFSVIFNCVSEWEKKCVCVCAHIHPCIHTVLGCAELSSVIYSNAQTTDMRSTTDFSIRKYCKQLTSQWVQSSQLNG